MYTQLGAESVQSATKKAYLAGMLILDRLGNFVQLNTRNPP